MKGDGVGMVQGREPVFSHFLLPMLFFSPDSVNIFAADGPLIRDHTPSAGESTEEKGGRKDWMRSGGRDTFGFQSPKPI